MADSKSYGQIACEAYYNHCEGQSLVDGQPLMKWEQLPADVQEAWCVAGDAAVAAISITRKAKIQTQDPVNPADSDKPSVDWQMIGCTVRLRNILRRNGIRTIKQAMGVASGEVRLKGLGVVLRHELQKTLDFLSDSYS